MTATHDRLVQIRKDVRKLRIFDGETERRFLVSKLSELAQAYAELAREEYRQRKNRSAIKALLRSSGCLEVAGLYQAAHDILLEALTLCPMDHTELIASIYSRMSRIDQEMKSGRSRF
jgi:predicted membrane chloride channel (bestrophin family)